MEYIVERNGLVWGGTGWWLSLQQAKVFKSRSRAKAIADKEEGKVVLYLGKPAPNGSKSHQPEKRATYYKGM